MKILISGGGTGGHIFPALSIANAVRRRMPDAEILFVGAEGRMEMERVPAAGYEIVGLPVAGFDRKRLWRNFGVLLKLWRSMRKAKKVLRTFAPDACVGVGGYASVHLDINGKTVQEGCTSDMLFKVDEIIEYISRFYTLKTGDILYTGTPAGIGAVSIDDHLEGWIEDRKVLEFNCK